jgi:C4-dicarboxylate-specific signal transduction histidine kinase
MTDRVLPPDVAARSAMAAEARRLAEEGLHEQATGNLEEAERLLTQAQDIDTDAVAEVLREHDAGRAPDARLQDVADQDVERVLPRIRPGPV